MYILPLTKVLQCGVLVLVIVATPLLAAETKTVVTNMKSNVQTDYMNGLLKLALSYSDKNYIFSTTTEVYSRPRVVESVKSGVISVMWGGTSEEMERDFIPIRIDAYRGLMNHRLLFIRQGDQARFDKIKTLEDLKQIRFGQGRSWQDASILESAGLTVVKTTKKTQSLPHARWWTIRCIPARCQRSLDGAVGISRPAAHRRKKSGADLPLTNLFFRNSQRPRIS